MCFFVIENTFSPNKTLLVQLTVNLVLIKDKRIVQILQTLCSPYVQIFIRSEDDCSQYLCTNSLSVLYFQCSVGSCSISKFHIITHEFPYFNFKEVSWKNKISHSTEGMILQAEGGSVCYLLETLFLLRLFLDPEYGGDKLLRNINLNIYMS